MFRPLFKAALQIRNKKTDSEAKSQTGAAVTPALGVLADLSNQDTRTLIWQEKNMLKDRPIQCGKYSLEAHPQEAGTLSRVPQNMDWK